MLNVSKKVVKVWIPVYPQNTLYSDILKTAHLHSSTFSNLRGNTTIKRYEQGKEWTCSKNIPKSLKSYENSMKLIRNSNYPIHIF